MASNKYEYIEAVKGLANPSSEEDFEHIQPKAGGSSFDNLSEVKSEEFDMLPVHYNDTTLDHQGN